MTNVSGRGMTDRQKRRIAAAVANPSKKTPGTPKQHRKHVKRVRILDERGE